MRMRIFVGLLVLAWTSTIRAQDAKERAVLVIHGGAGVEARRVMTPAMEKTYRADLERALKAGFEAMKQSNSSLDAVESAIRVLEDSPMFNAGNGAVFNRDGRNELNASIMEGKNRNAGAVAGVCRIKNPISAARAVMEKSDHVFLIGEGAERFAKSQGLEDVSPLYFWTESAWKQMMQAKSKSENKRAAAEPAPSHFGTVGAVAVNRDGNLAAGTSTGGINYRLPGRVGDSPIIGAGTYADNRACAVSCTGVGELFIRHSVAHDIAARMQYRGDSLEKATTEVLNELPKRPDGVGGIISLDRQGHFQMRFNTNGMYRGYVTQEGRVWVGIHEN